VTAGRSTGVCGAPTSPPSPQPVSSTPKAAATITAVRLPGLVTALPFEASAPDGSLTSGARVSPRERERAPDTRQPPSRSVPYEYRRAGGPSDMVADGWRGEPDPLPEFAEALHRPFVTARAVS